ncbi:MAG: hypothetical protein HYV93_19105 [Candidatus Rokubacteria bacterium]|nr:hypothetical protein [Candidatus Rokubacteria bacterium]
MRPRSLAREVPFATNASRLDPTLEPDSAALAPHAAGMIRLLGLGGAAGVDARTIPAG